MNENYRNHSGYWDPTAGKAMTRIERAEAAKVEEERLNALKTRTKVYVVSKYRGDIEVNVWKAINCCKYVISKGMMPVASHLLYPQFLDDKEPGQRDMGCQFGLALLALCDEVWVFNENRELSEGMRVEIREARLLKKPVKYHDMRDLKI